MHKFQYIGAWTRMQWRYFRKQNQIRFHHGNCLKRGWIHFFVSADKQRPKNVPMCTKIRASIGFVVTDPIVLAGSIYTASVFSIEISLKLEKVIFSARFAEHIDKLLSFLLRIFQKVNQTFIFYFSNCLFQISLCNLRKLWSMVNSTSCFPFI